ncbi:ROR1 kinase, partial [Acromyrmex insinuator]
FLIGGNGDVEDSDTDVQDYSTDEDYNDVFDSTTNGTDVDAASGTKSGTLKFVRTLTNISKDAGGVAHMRCEVVGDPPPTKIRWYKNEAPLEENRPKITIKKIHAQMHEHVAQNLAGSRLKITNLDVSDIGFYTCRVTNGKDQIQSEGTLRVDSSKKWPAHFALYRNFVQTDRRIVAKIYFARVCKRLFHVIRNRPNSPHVVYIVNSKRNEIHIANVGYTRVSDYRW